KERQAFVAAHVIVGAHEFVAGIADQDRSSHEFEAVAAGGATKTSLAYVGDRMAAILFDKRLVVRSRRAAEIGHRDQAALQQRRSHSEKKASRTGAAEQPAEAGRRITSWCSGTACPRSKAAAAWI